MFRGAAVVDALSVTVIHALFPLMTETKYLPDVGSMLRSVNDSTTKLLVEPPYLTVRLNLVTVPGVVV
jgi:hypothetical protein